MADPNFHQKVNQAARAKQTYGDATTWFQQNMRIALSCAPISAWSLC
jgi:hypothetical protein